MKILLKASLFISSCFLGIVLLSGCQTTTSSLYSDQVVISPYSDYNNIYMYDYRYRNTMYYRAGFYDWGYYPQRYHSHSHYYYRSH